MHNLTRYQQGVITTATEDALDQIQKIFAAAGWKRIDTYDQSAMRTWVYGKGDDSVSLDFWHGKKQYSTAKLLLTVRKERNNGAISFKGKPIFDVIETYDIKLTEERTEEQYLQWNAGVVEKIKQFMG